MRKRLVVSIFFLSLWGLLCMVAVRGRQNEDAERKKPHAKNSTTDAAGRNRPAKRPRVAARAVKRVAEKEKVPAFAEVEIYVQPADSIVVINGVEHRAEQGRLSRRETRLGPSSVVVRRSGFREKEYEIDLVAGHRAQLNVTLERAPGTVNVVPGVNGALITIVNVETGQEVGKFAGRASGIELSPGRYQVTVSKNGYHPSVREIVVESEANFYLEPPLERLPPEPPPARVATAAAKFRLDAITRLQSVPDGKYLVLTLTGRSGETTSPLGSVDVTLNAGGGRTTAVSGMLTGFPCQVDFVRLENVAEYSFVEPPGPANQWQRVVVRIRPKDSKRQMRFLINWRRL